MNHARAPLSFLGTSTTILFSETTDDYDDWYADFDPSEYEQLDTNRNNRGRTGGGGGDHDYTRDLQADNSNVNLETVNALISERLEYRKTGRYDEADDIRDVLLQEHGVAIFDREKVWRSGCSTGGSGMKWRPNQENERAPRKRNFGPNGHDYQLAQGAGPNTSSLTEEEIHALLAERLEYKLNRQFRDADAIQEELIQAGVHVHDGTKEWRADGESLVGNEREMSNYVGGGRKQLYQQSPHSLATNDADEIQDLVNQRMDAKKARAYRDADELRDVLRADYNVEINDKLKQWSVGGDFGIPTRDRNYAISPDSEVPENANEIQQLVEERNEARKVRDFDTADAIRDELLDQNVMVDDKLCQWAVGGRFSTGSVGGDFRIPTRDRNYAISPDSEVPENANEIQQLVEERNEARKARDFDTADAIRDELLDQNVMVDDKLCQWAVGGRFGKGNNGRLPPNTPFSKRGAGGDLTEEQEAVVTKLLQERSAAQRDKQFGKADRIRDRLQEEFKVRIDDRSREWHVVSEKYANVSPFDLDDDVQTLIEEKIVQRAVAKLEKDYDTADAIRDELAEKYNVYIDDRLREWIVIGKVPSSSAMGDVDIDDSVFEVDESNFEDEQDENEVVDSGEAMDNDVDLTSLTIPELKVRLKEAGLPVSGRKAELIERLTS
jgi:cysteinyl-tRNA synthetase